MAFTVLLTHIGFGLFLVVLATMITYAMLKHVRVLDIPNHRSSHKDAIPKCGGISIVFTFFIGMLVIGVVSEMDLAGHQFYYGLLVSSMLVAVISFLDDVNEKTPLFKLISHIVAVVVVLSSGIVIRTVSLPWAEAMTLGFSAYVISFIWILGLTNAVNFMDGADGLVGSTTFIVALYFMVISYYQGSVFVYISCYTIIAGAVGFLIYNSPKAKIFMGDVGSAFIGFVFAALAIIAARYDAGQVSIFVMPLLLFHFIYDTAFTVIRRALRGEPVLQAHRGHLYQLLLRTEFSHLEVTLLLSCMAFLQGLGAIWMEQIPGDERLFVFAPFLLIQLCYTHLTLRRARKFGIKI